MIRVRQHLTTKGHWVDYHGWNWVALPLHEKRIISRQVDHEDETAPQAPERPGAEPCAA